MISTLYMTVYGCPKDKRENDCPLLEIEHLSFIVLTIGKRKNKGLQEYSNMTL